MFTANVRHTLRSIFAFSDIDMVDIVLRLLMRLSYRAMSEFVFSMNMRKGITFFWNSRNCSVASWQA